MFCRGSPARPLRPAPLHCFSATPALNPAPQPCPCPFTPAPTPQSSSHPLVLPPHPSVLSAPLNVVPTPLDPAPCPQCCPSPLLQPPGFFAFRPFSQAGGGSRAPSPAPRASHPLDPAPGKELLGWRGSRPDTPEARPGGYELPLVAGLSLLLPASPTLEEVPGPARRQARREA